MDINDAIILIRRRIHSTDIYNPDPELLEEALNVILTELDNRIPKGAIFTLIGADYCERHSAEIKEMSFDEFKDDQEYASRHDMLEDLEPYPPYQGIVVPRWDIENADSSFESEDAIVVQTLYPTEKCYPEVDWFTIGNLLDEPDLIKVVIVE